MILSGTLQSKSLGMETGVTVITPDRFRMGIGTKVAYLLHGLYGGNRDLVDFTRLPYYAKDRQVTFIMPEAGRSFYTDMAHGQKFFTYIAEELPRHCRSTFNISDRREDTAVFGVSMGGYGALKAALSHPADFGYCCAISPARLFLKQDLESLRTEEGRRLALARYGAQMVEDMYSIYGERLAWSEENELFDLAQSAVRKGPFPKIYCACGTEDYLYPDNLRFARKVRSISSDYTFETWTGRHDWNFFDEALNRALTFCYGEPTDG